MIKELNFISRLEILLEALPWHDLLTPIGNDCVQWYV